MRGVENGGGDEEEGTEEGRDVPGRACMQQQRPALLMAIPRIPITTNTDQEGSVHLAQEEVVCGVAYVAVQ